MILIVTRKNLRPSRFSKSFYDIEVSDLIYPDNDFDCIIFVEHSPDDKERFRYKELKNAWVDSDIKGGIGETEQSLADFVVERIQNFIN